jgi:hypothetical protein
MLTCGNILTFRRGKGVWTVTIQHEFKADSKGWGRYAVPAAGLLQAGQPQDRLIALYDQIGSGPVARELPRPGA